MFYPDLALLKVPLLLAAVYFARLCGKPPQPTPKKCEERKFAGLEAKGFRTIIRWLPPLLIVPSMYLTLAFDASSILLSNDATLGRSALPPRLYKVLSPGAGQDVRLTSTFLLGWFLLASGALIRLTCYHYLGRFFTFELALKDDHQLVTAGPYSIVRHPAYTGSILALTGIALIELGPGSWWTERARLWSTPVGAVLACVWLGMLFIVPAGIVTRTTAEDQVLQEEFGEQWEVWAQKTGYKLLPGVF